ncbi:MAG: FAD-dependent oxidoreductase [Verrucomicrobiales bacterium]|nr:FAD-dependent oxidoreductase [Verrucomicrobiales bacterium]
MNYRNLIAAAVAWALLSSSLGAATYDVVVYGGTSAGVMAAVQAKRMGRSVILVCPDQHLGGLSSGGLGWTDTGNKAVIGGLARQFYHRVWQHYQGPDAWKWQAREEYGNRGQGTPAIDGAERTMWIFEPHVAEQVFEDFIRENDIPVQRNLWLDREHGVVKENGRIVEITLLDGESFTGMSVRGRMFIDATYEGDLLAAAGVDYTVGREAQSVYDEKWNGVQTGVLHHRHHFGVLKQKIDPYVVPGDPASGVLPNVSAEPPGEYGSGDRRLQAYCFRMCLTDRPENRVPFPKPEGYDAGQYELLLRIFDAGWDEVFQKFDPIPNHKTDTNNHGPMSTDYIGANYDYPEASYARRREIIQAHARYQQGWLWFIAHDPRVPARFRERMNQWGLAKDEFTDNGNWPHQIYVREARRMIGRFVMTENELLRRRPTPESVGMGSYTIDSHNVQRYITPDGSVQNEGDIGVGTPGPYEIAYGALVPKKGQADNLLVPVCVSASHIAFGSIRMEPVFMILGQSAATAASLALDADLSVQDVPYARLRQRLLRDGQVLEADTPAERTAGAAIDPAKLPGIVVDDDQAVLTGDWQISRSVGSWVGNGYRHDGNQHDPQATAAFATKLPKAALYEVRLAYSAHDNRSSAVRVTVDNGSSITVRRLNQKKAPPIEGLWASLGTFEFPAGKPVSVTVSNQGANGYVVIDAVQWLSHP